jgi:prevent-host-death family protein
MATSMTVSEARAALSEIVDRVSAGEEVTLTRHGVAVAVVVHPAALKVRRAGPAYATASAVHDLLESGRRAILGATPAVSAERTTELIREVRANRSAR